MAALGMETHWRWNWSKIRTTRDLDQSFLAWLELLYIPGQTFRILLGHLNHLVKYAITRRDLSSKRALLKIADGCKRMMKLLKTKIEKKELDSWESISWTDFVKLLQEDDSYTTFVEWKISNDYVKLWADRYRGFHLVSKHEDHIHVVHDCAYTGSHCRCARYQEVQNRRRSRKAVWSNDPRDTILV